MELDKLEISLRRRSAWEAIDLGFALARRWFMPLWLLWLTSAVPLGVLLFLLFNEQLWLLMILVWWFKPLYEPPLLFWLSRAVFGEQLKVKTVIHQWWSVIRPQLFINLTLRRFNPSRSFTMPVALLEQLKGKARRSRISILGKNQHAATWLTIVGIHLETILELAFITTLFVLIPEDLRWVSLDDLIVAPGRIGEWLQLAGGLLCMSLIAPFYVAAGFALYLHRRSELEAWDIEINFRQINERVRESQTSKAKRFLSISVLFIALSGLAVFHPVAEAAGKLSAREAKPVIEQVLADDDFGRTEETQYWKYVGSTDSEEAEAEDHWFRELLEMLFKRIGGFFEGYASIGKILIWIVGISLVVYLIYRVMGNTQWFSGLKRSRKRNINTPVELFGLDLRPEQLPDNPAAIAQQLAEAGEYREALSLLYRGALVFLVTEQAIDIPDSATEGECQLLVSQYRDVDESEYFSQLTHSWLAMAYGHILPEQEQVLALCQQWSGVFGHEPG